MRYLVDCWIRPRSGFATRDHNILVNSLKSLLRDNVSEDIENVSEHIQEVLDKHEGMVIDTFVVKTENPVSDPETEIMPEIKKANPEAEFISMTCVSESDSQGTFMSKIYNDSAKKDENGDPYVIQYMTDDDLYKLSMQQYILHNCSRAVMKARFKCRTDGVDLLPFKKEIEKQIDHICNLSYTEEELNFIEQKCKFLSPDYVDFLRMFYLRRKYVTVKEKNGKLDIVIRGPWLHTIPFEVKILKIVHECYTRALHKNTDLDEGRERLQAKIQMVKKYESETGQKLIISDFGTRRCFSGEWHEEVVSTMAEAGVLSGTSNVMLSMFYDLKPIGTMAHELFQAGQALGPRLSDAQQFVMDSWAKEYRGDLGIVLSDTYGDEKFLADFDRYFAKLFDGARHDSGNPFLWGDRLIDHYKHLGIDPRTKTLVFSDGLDIPTVIRLAKYFSGRIRVAFGVGTNLTNDIGPKALQLVIKMVECGRNYEELQPVAKISNNPAKSMCEDTQYEQNLMTVITRDIKRKRKNPNHILNIHCVGKNEYLN